MPTLPVPPNDELKLADWLEILALISDDQRASLGDLERALRRSSVLETGDDQRTQEAIGEKSVQVVSELRARARSAKEAYPFALDGSTVRVIGTTDRWAPYLFCLCLSAIGASQPRSQQLFPRRLFEHLSRVAAAAYLGGDSVRFASPRTGLPRPFAKAVTVLCNRLGEGERFRDQPSLSRKDATLDVVAWKYFPDLLPGKIILFGQCASGADWTTKLAALRPKDFCDQWMLEPPPSSLLRACFIPHRVPAERWNWFTRQGGILFDRCRLAYWSDTGAGAALLRQILHWTRLTLRQAKQLNSRAVQPRRKTATRRNPRAGAG